MRILYYPGCTVKATAIRDEKASLAVLEALGFEVIEVEDWICCGAVFNLPRDTVIQAVAPIRTLIRAESTKSKHSTTNILLTLCSMCNHVLKMADNLYKNDPDAAYKLDSYLTDEPKYRGELRIMHFLEILRDLVGYEKIREKVKRELRGLKVASFYGCFLLRPREVAIDDPEDPIVIEEIMIRLGADPVDYPYRNECCGSFNVVRTPQHVWDRVKDIVESAYDYGAELIVTTCPLCAYNLEEGQKKRKAELKGCELPILYVSELLAYAFGMDDVLEPEVRSILDKMVGSRE